MKMLFAVPGVRVAILALLIGCTPASQTITAAHPAHPDAEPGRLAGPPPALRPGVAEVTPPAPAHDEHAGHEMPAAPAPEPAKPEEAKPPAKKPAAKPPAKKPSAKPPAKDPHEGHTPAKPAADPHQGHHGH